MTDWQIELTWVCSSCQHRNLGRHTECVQCGSPKDASEEYEMPGAPSRARAVRDPGLVQMAKAGANWRCGYCGSDQRRSDDACARCGAESAAGTTVGDAHTPPRAQPQGFFATTASRVGALVAALGAVAVVAAVVLHRSPPPRKALRAGVQVATVHWEHLLEVERWQVLAREGFAETQPPTAFDVVSGGPRVHHHEQVLDHYETEHYTVRVQDGYDTQSYTERVSCGQDCTPTPRSCRTSCTSNRNGFANCREVCSGGGQSCSTRYCTEHRTRQVPRYRNDPRTREVPRYRSEPRYAEWFTWRIWDWAHNRLLHAEGDDATVRWPDEAVAATPLGPGERERARRIGHYRVTFDLGDVASFTYAPPTAEDFGRYVPGGRFRLDVTADGRGTLRALP